MTLARCKRCEQTFCLAPMVADESAPASVCHYHPGQYRRWWSCCREMSHGARGCREGVHVEDVAASAMLDSIAEKLQAQREQERAPKGDVVIFEGPEGELTMARFENHAEVEMLARECEEEEAAASTGSAPPAGLASAESSSGEANEAAVAGDGGDAMETVLVPYLVGPFDSFASICMREQMVAEELMRVNGLAIRHVRPGTTVLVWGLRSKGQQQVELNRQLVAQFRRLTKTSAGEARYYLEENGYQIEAALTQRRDDLAWETEPSTPEALRLALTPESASDSQTCTMQPKAGGGADLFASLLKCAQSFGRYVQ
uniref:Uncharacterized protein n=1 Tax=Coccolithus braarudii TaxID=221442 RepID=A0A7S0LC59_9EUKA|mmetsp:Transcript_29019/g.62437  ORF Transcript_29019/g.62437 Transcript_29019/m.62437 type:complete len:315 (+) Transcript_29019:102-1046(+)